MRKSEAKKNVGSGWCFLIDTLYDRIPHVDAITNVQNVHGRLRVTITSGHESDDLLATVQTIERWSEHFCEVCSKAGEQRSLPLGTKVLCLPCYINENGGTK